MVYYRLGYHKQFDGYAERKVTEGGRTRIERVYIGNFYQQDISEKKRITRKIIYASFIVAAIALWVIVSISGLKGLEVKYVAAAPALVIFPAFFSVRAVIYYCMAGRKMRINEFRLACRHLKISTLILALFLFASALVFIYYAVSSDTLMEMWPGAALFMIGSALTAFVSITEFRTDYEIVENEINQNGEYDNAVEITW